MKYQEISTVHQKLNELKHKFRYYQNCIVICKAEIYDPYDTELDRWEWERANQYEISCYSFILKSLADEIKDTRKLLKQLNRKQNIKEHQ